MVVVEVPVVVDCSTSHPCFRLPAESVDGNNRFSLVALLNRPLDCLKDIDGLGHLV